MRPLPPLLDAARNPTSLVGIAIATAMALVFAVLFSLELLGYLTNPYAGLLVFVTVPVMFVAGLLLIPIGVRRERRRRARGVAASAWPVLDLRDSSQRTVVVGVLALTLVNVVIVSLGAYGSVHYMESSEFCGQVCHTTMQPQYVAYQRWPHARVACVQCHVGPGAGALVQSKLAGTRQLYHVITNRVPTPVPPPAHLISPTRETCERCHWSELSHGDRLRVIREYANDEANSETITRLQLHVGGGSVRRGIGNGIHWHMNLANRIEYVAADDPAGTIPYVRLTTPDGQQREYFAEGASGQPARGTRRQMDCIDCHNRPAHTFSPSPQRAVDMAMSDGALPRQLPFLRREAVAALTAGYADESTARAAIAKRLTDFYHGRGSDARLLQRAVATTQELWSANVFPAMKVTWGTYPNNIGHVDSPGCFRCHDDSHKANDGSVIRQDCELCHTAPE